MTDKELLEHDLCPRLTYGVKGTFILSDVVNLKDGQRDESRIKELNSDSLTFFLKYCKPFLRPMSDLTKPITHKAETFIVFDLIVEKMQAGEVLCVKNMDMLPFWIVEILRKYHFALDLPAHLWADVNTLTENCYA
jgi:hypothetical protein